MHTVRQLAPIFAPSRYRLTLDISRRQARQFKGEVVITGELALPGHITLHAKDLTIEEATINAQPATVRHGKDDELKLDTGGLLQPGKHEVRIVFSGGITDAMHGLYPCYYKDEDQEKELLVTQLESHSAREVFPCVDEPAAKAVFDLTLVTEQDVTVVGNMPISAQHTTAHTLSTHFEASPKMSPYLLAFASGDLQFSEATSKNGVKVRIYATPGNVQYAAFSLELSTKLLDFYDDFFGIPYPLPKCDLIAVPDFSALGMENWGLIVCRENGLLVDQDHSSAIAKELVATVVTHELAHQWFGNLVTMRWWDDLWLNESFAKWMEHFAIDHFFPEWRTWEQFNGSEQAVAFTRDSLAVVQAVRQRVNHPDELHSLFDPAIVYAKGSCLIRMLQEFVGAEAFQNGLQTYMKRHKYGNAAADDLWHALEAASGKDVRTFMLPWLTQPGHPLVHVEVNGPHASLTQQRFFANPEAPTDTAIWPVPLLSEQFSEQSFSTPHLGSVLPDGLPLLNKGGGGFYHTKYEPRHLAALSQKVADNSLAPIDRQTLLADALQLTRGGQYATSDLLELLSHYHQETSYAVWQSIGSAVEGLKIVVDADPDIMPKLRRYIISLASLQYKRLGWQPKKDEPYYDELLRPTVVGLMAYAQHPEATAHALALFDAAKTVKDIPAHVRTTVMAAAVRERGISAYERLLAWYEETPSAEERVDICAGISGLQDPAIARQAVALFTGKSIRRQDLRYWFVYFMRNPYARQVGWEWMVSHWDWIEKQFKNGHEYGDFPKYSAMGLCRPEELATYKAFFEPKMGEIELARLIAQGIDDVSIRVQWRGRDAVSVADYLARF